MMLHVFSRFFLIVLLHIVLDLIVYIAPAVCVFLVTWDKQGYRSLVTHPAYISVMAPVAIYLVTVYIHEKIDDMFP
jgi:hypothetical protein